MSSFLKEFLENIQKWRFWFWHFWKGQIFRVFLGLAPSKMIFFFQKYITEPIPDSSLLQYLCVTHHNPIFIFFSLIKNFFLQPLVEIFFSYHKKYFYVFGSWDPRKPKRRKVKNSHVEFNSKGIFGKYSKMKTLGFTFSKKLFQA